jgi:hypothetical protein
MAPKMTGTQTSNDIGAGLNDLPHDELLRYGAGLGLDLDKGDSADSIVARIRARQELLLELSHDALLDIVVWARRPVRKSATKEELAREIARIERTNYDSLSMPGLVALARLRDLPANLQENSQDIIDLLRSGEGFWKKLQKKRRALLSNVVARLLESDSHDNDGDYRFLPENEGNDAGPARGSLRTHIEEHGLVGGIANRLRGAADDYIKQKLDEIEQRIDAKMDQIDRRLAEWRDREVANRLKILRITLIFSVLVAIVSLGYKMVSKRVEVVPVGGPPPSAQPATPDGRH